MERPSQADRLPNLLIVGVAKAGTTSLFWYLAQHPDVCGSSQKEVNFFSPVIYGRHPEMSLDHYAGHFDECSGERYRLEATPKYFLGGRELAKVVDETLPGVRILVNLRNPVDRFWSAYRYTRLQGGIAESVTVGEFYEKCLGLHQSGEDGLESNARYRALSVGRYGDFLDGWLDVFGERLRVVFFEDLVAAPIDTVVDLAGWLEVDQGVVEGFDMGVSQRTIEPRSRRLHRGARRLAATADRVLDLNRHRVLKGRLRRLYHLVNTSKPAAVMPDETRRSLEDFYRGPTIRLAADLRERGYTTLPSWLQTDTNAGSRS